MERAPSKALTDAYAQPSKIPKFNQASTSTGSLLRQASRGIQSCPSQPKLDLTCKPAYACMMHFFHSIYAITDVTWRHFFAPNGKHETCMQDLLCGAACNQISSPATQCCT